MDEELKIQMLQDIELAKTMTDIQSGRGVLEVVNRLIGYLDIVNTGIADHEYKASILKGKRRTLEEYIRSGKEIAKNLSVSEYLVSNNKK